MKYESVTFDCYGTLIDWEGGIAAAFRSEGITADREVLMRAYLEVEPQVEAGAYRRYRDVLIETAQRVAEKLGKRTDGKFLPESLSSWKPFPDTNAALEQLPQKGCALGILSNVDDDLLAETLKHFTVKFDLIITAQKVGSYKPAHGHFLVARKRIGSKKWIHAAQSYFHDIVPASALGIPSAWINRKNEKPAGSARPTVQFRDLTEFSRWM